MKTDRPKQSLVLNGTPIIVHTILKFDACSAIDYVIVTAPRESVDEVRDLIKSAGFKKAVSVIQGGDRRQDSVAVGLQNLQPGTQIVAVHDGVRPFVTPEEIDQVVAAARETGAAVLTAAVACTSPESPLTRPSYSLTVRRRVAG